MPVVPVISLITWWRWMFIWVRAFACAGCARRVADQGLALAQVAPQHAGLIIGAEGARGSRDGAAVCTVA